MTKDRRTLEALVDLLDDLPLDDDAVKAEAEAMGIDFAAWAAEMEAADREDAARARNQKFAAAEASYRAETARFAKRSTEPRRAREEQIAIVKSLVARAPASVAMHFHKFEECDDDELAATIAKLRYLLDDDDS